MLTRTLKRPWPEYRHSPTRRPGRTAGRSKCAGSARPALSRPCTIAFRCGDPRWTRRPFRLPSAVAAGLAAAQDDEGARAGHEHGGAGKSDSGGGAVAAGGGQACGGGAAGGGLAPGLLGGAGRRRNPGAVGSGMLNVGAGDELREGVAVAKATAVAVARVGVALARPGTRGTCGAARWPTSSTGSPKARARLRRRSRRSDVTTPCPPAVAPPPRPVAPARRRAGPTFARRPQMARGAPWAAVPPRRTVGSVHPTRRRKGAR